MELLEKKVIRAGQARAYQDSVYQWEIKTTQGTDDEAWALCQSLRKAENRKDGASHNGTCAFEFGLQSYGSLSKLSNEGTAWRYTVTDPYCD